MKPLIVSRTDMGGGAARAALRLALLLREHGMDTDILASAKMSDFFFVIGGKGNLQKAKTAVRGHIGTIISRLQQCDRSDIRSFNVIPSNIDRHVNKLPHDVVNLHWVGAEYISIESIGRIKKPLVWTLHDMWAFCGAEHYAPDDFSARWRREYSINSRLPETSGLDLDRYTWRRKHRAWRNPQHIICPSRWLADCVAGSSLMGHWPIHVIPNAINLSVFRPWPKAIARQMLGLPLDVPLLGFGAAAGTTDLRKGWDLLCEALINISTVDIRAEAVIFGQSRPEKQIYLPMETHWTGYIHDDIVLALLYSAVDVVVVPSRQDNLPQTATEPQACGCPVVSFDVGGLSDAVDAGVTGYLVPPFDTNKMAERIIDLLTNKELRENQSAAARKRALSIWDPLIISNAHRSVYMKAISV